MGSIEGPEPADAGSKTSTMRGAVSPFGKGLAQIIALADQKPDEAERLLKFMQTSEKDPGSPYYRPYARPTNKGAVEELSRLGIDTADINEKWFEDNAWLKQYVRTGAAGLPKVPTSKSSREETAAYYYKRLADSEGRTRQAETELSGLRREIGYWAGRKDRNYSDEEIVSRIYWNKYPALTMLREDQRNGRPTPLNRAVDLDSDTVFGMLWSARNGNTGESSIIQAARYALGEGRQYEPDETVRTMRDIKSSAYNPYALGSTADEAAEYFKVDGFDEKWLDRNISILQSGNETAIRHYNQVYGAEQATKAAENEIRKLTDRLGARLNKAVSAGVTLDANVLLKDALFGLDTLQSMDERRVSGDLVQLTRPVNYRWQDVAGKVSGQVQMINARQNAPYNPAQLELAARNEEEKVINGQGTLIQKDAVPRSYTSFHNKMPGLWAAGLTKNPLSAGWYAPAAGAPSGFGVDQMKAQAIADFRRAGDFVGAAAQGYDALTGSGGDISKLSTNEGAARMAIDLALDSAKAISPEQTAIPAVQDTNARHDAVVNSILGIDPETVTQLLPQILYATTVQGDISNQAAGTIGLLSSILRLGEGALKTVTDHVLGDAPTLQTAQTMFRMLKLRDMDTGTKSEALQTAEAALKKTASNTLKSTSAQTGESELDDLTVIANQSPHNLDAVMKRWGFQGVNYIGNLLKAGRGDLATAITAMPTYAKSAIVAETNMRTFGVNDDAIAAQESALKADMQSPIVVLSAKQIAKQQAVEARKAKLIAGGGTLIQSVLVQKVNEAGKTVNQTKAALDQAVRNEQACRNALYKAQDAFRKNMADSAAADVLAAAIEQLQKATTVREKAQMAFTLNQQTLNDAQWKLTDAQKQAEVRVEEQAKLDVDAMVKNLAATKTKLQGMAGGQAGEQGEVQSGRTQNLDMQNAAPNVSLYLNGNPTAEVKRETDQKTSSADLIAEYKSMIREGLPINGSNNANQAAAFQFQKDMMNHFKTLSPQDQKILIGLTKKYWAKAVTEDELKTLNILKPDFMPDLPMPKCAMDQSTLAPDDGSCIINAANEIPEEPGADDVLNVVLTPEQLGVLAEINNDVLRLLTDEQRQRMNAGENINVIISELDSIKQAQINQLSQNVLKELEPQQKRDLLFLGSGLFADIDLKTRQAILQHLKENGGEITYDDLVDLGVYEPGALAEGGLKRWLQDLDMGGGPAHFADLLAEEYALSDFDTSFAKLDQEQRNQRGAEMTMLFAMIAAPLIDTAVYGRALSPNDRYNPNSRLDNIEQEGWSIKGPQSFIDPPEVAGDSGGPAAEVGNPWHRSDGTINMPPNNGAVAGSEEIIDLQPGDRLGRFGGFTRNSDFVAEPGSSDDSLSLPPYIKTSIYQEFEVLKPIPGVMKSIVMPWGNSKGLGTQYKLPMTIQELIDQLYIQVLP